MHELYASFRALLDAYPGDRVSIGELHHPDYETWALYYGERQDEIHVPYNFHLAYADWRPDAVRAAIDGVEGALPLGAWASWVLGNHDHPRFASPHRAGAAQAKVGMLLLLTLRGMPTIYYGDEIGMADAPIDPAGARDPLGRDPQRTPMQWDSSPNAGFTTAEARPWLPLAAEADRLTVTAQAADADSLLTLTRRLLQLRREHPVLRAGDFEPIGVTSDGTYGFRRVSTDGRLTVVLNLTDSPRSVPDAGPGRVLIGTDRDREAATVGDVAELRPNEAFVIEADD